MSELEVAELEKFRIPPCPIVVLGVLREQAKPEANLSRIASLIASDIGLAAEILREVNSPLLGLSRKVTSIQEAIFALGLRRISAIVAAAKLIELSGVPREVGAKIWEHSRRVAEFSAKLAKYAYSAEVTPEDAYTAGMLHDSGIFLLIRDPEYVKGQVRDDIQNVASEDAKRHAYAGAQLLKYWHLPEIVYEGVRYHHSLCDAPPEQPAIGYMASVIIMAERLALMMDDPFAEVTREFRPECMEALSCLQLSADEFIDIQYSLYEKLA